MPLPPLPRRRAIGAPSACRGKGGLFGVLRGEERRRFFLPRVRVGKWLCRWVGDAAAPCPPGGACSREEIAVFPPRLGAREADPPLGRVGGLGPAAAWVAIPRKRGADGRFCRSWGRGVDPASASPAFRGEAGILGSFGGGEREVRRPCLGAMVCRRRLRFERRAGGGEAASSEGWLRATHPPGSKAGDATGSSRAVGGPRSDGMAHLLPPTGSPVSCKCVRGSKL